MRHGHGLVRTQDVTPGPTDACSPPRQTEWHLDCRSLCGDTRGSAAAAFGILSVEIS